MTHLIHNQQRPSVVLWQIFKNQNRHKNSSIFKEFYMSDSVQKCHRLFTLYSNFSSFVLSNVSIHIHYRSLTSEKILIGSIFFFRTILESNRSQIVMDEVLYFIHSDFVYIHHPSETCRHHMFSKSKIHPINLIFFIGDDESNHSLTIERKNETKLV